MSNFDFSLGSQSIPIVSFTASSLAFNSRCIELLGSPPYVGIGFSHDNNSFAVKPLLENCDNYHCYNFLKSEKKLNNISIKSYSLLQKLKKTIPLGFYRKIKLKAEWDSDEKMLIVDLREKNYISKE